MAIITTVNASVYQNNFPELMINKNGVIVRFTRDGCGTVMAVPSQFELRRVVSNKGSIIDVVPFQVMTNINMTAFERFNGELTFKNQ